MARISDVPINPEVLKWARENAGYTLDGLAKQLKVKGETLKEWENGKSRPTFAKLKDIAAKLKRPSAFFFLPTPPKEPAQPKDFRVVSEADHSRLAPKTIAEIRKAWLKRQIALELAEDMEESPKNFSQKTSLDVDPSEIAQRFRKKIGLTADIQIQFKSPNVAFHYWKDAIEAFDVLVFQASLDSLEEMRGLALFYAKYPIILLNTKDSPNGKTFSLLHEYCHLLLNQSGIGNMTPSFKSNRFENKIEIFCNKFAAECILPNEIFLQHRQDFELSEAYIKKLSKKYLVSQDVILRKAYDHRLISKDVYQSAIGQLKKSYSKKQRGGFKRYQEKVFDYHGPKFTSLVLNGFAGEHITAAQASNYLGAKIEYLPKIEAVLKDRKKSS